MIFSLTIALLTSSVAPQWYREKEFPPPERVQAMVEACDVADATVGFDKLLQSDVVTFSERIDLNEIQLACLAEVAFQTGYTFLIPEAFAPAFYAHKEAIAAPWNRELATEHLAELGKLAGLPVPAEGETDVEFARKLESHCEAHGALSSEFGPQAISPDWVVGQRSDFDTTGKAMLCLLSSGTLSGFEIGMIGNEAMSENTGDGGGS